MSGYTDITKLETTRNCLRRIARHDEQQFSKDSIVNVMERFVKTVNVMDDTILVPCRLMDRQIGDSTDIIPAIGKDTTANQLTKSATHSSKSKNVHEFLSASELFNLYNMLNVLKNDLLWTGKDDNGDDDDDAGIDEQIANDSSKDETNLVEVAHSNSTTAIGVVKGHVRRTSTASVASTASVSNMSDSDSDVSQENDSGLETDGNKSDNAQHISSSIDCSSSSIGSDSSNASTSSIDDSCKTKKKTANVDKATELAKRCRKHLNGLYQCLEQMTEAANYLTARYQSDIGGPA